MAERHLQITCVVDGEPVFGGKFARAFQSYGIRGIHYWVDPQVKQIPQDLFANACKTLNQIIRIAG